MVDYKRILKFCILHFIFCSLILFPLLAFAGIEGSKHDLSVSGPGTVKAVTETGVCIFCHTPHNADPAIPLWNHDLSPVVKYTNYWSDTLKSYASEADAPLIDGFSKLCLSCHDGTVAIGATIKEIISVSPSKLVEGQPGYIGTNLSGGHPVSIVFDARLVGERQKDPGIMQLNWPIVDHYVKLYPTQDGYGVQCTSCHDPHTNRTTETKDGNPWPPFWQKATYDDVCLVCHNAAPPIGH